mmetsp:Transcript_51676/g.52634  ORF Transcript_51676/g.52634 Transcript_51676/m.52634 type:complete len:137 (+) Transcript_51676:226-636(+)
MNSLRLLLLFLSTVSVHSFLAGPSASCIRQRDGAIAISSTNRQDKIMSDIDIMCIENSADLCSFYDECDIEEREALLNRFAEQTEIMAGRIAEIYGLVQHLKSGDHKHLEADEVDSFRQKVLDLVNKETSDNSISP